MFLIFLLIIIASPQNYNVQCEIGYSFSRGTCRITNDNPLYMPQPIFDGCPKPCTYKNKICVENNRSLITLISPNNCQYWSNGICALNGTTTRCPSDCILHDQNCNPVFNNTCYPQYKWTCPYNCEYDIKQQKCLPVNDNTICELIPITLRCPKSCAYNYDLNKCMSNNINDICNYEYKLNCPHGCTLNPYGNKCIPINSNTVCNITYFETPLCSWGCNWNKKMNQCIPTNIDYVCEDNIQFQCSNYYIVNVNAPQCTLLNRDNLCKINNYTVTYPKRLEKYYNNLKCILKYQINCSNPGIMSCPHSCTIDYAKNQCTPFSNNILCGSVLLTCPINSSIYGAGCVPTNNPTCPPEKLLFNITDGGSLYKYNLMCGNVWYYGNITENIPNFDINSNFLNSYNNKINVTGQEYSINMTNANTNNSDNQIPSIVPIYQYVPYLITGSVILCTSIIIIILIAVKKRYNNKHKYDILINDLIK
jgi:hypothetical protein